MPGMSNDTPPPLANSRYRLAGGLDTPVENANAAFESIEPGSEPDFRRRMRGSLGSCNDGREVRHRQSMGGAVTGGGIERERNGGRRQPESAATLGQAQDNDTWSLYFMKMAGGIAGAMWDFCRNSTSTFTGFKAGGGPSYSIVEQSGGNRSVQPNNGQTDHAAVQPQPQPQPQRRRRKKDSTPVPGSYPLDDDYEFISHPTDTPEPSDRRSSKRLQTTQAGDWVVLEHSNNPNSRTQTPDSQPVSRRRTSYRSRPSTTATGAHTSATRPTGASRASIAARKPRLPHVNAGGRISSASLHGPASTPQYAHHQHIHNSNERRPSTATATRSPVQARTASPKRGAQDAAAHQKESPASADIQRYTAKRERLERQNDKSIRKLNSRLVDMINEGRQALGTRVDVEDSGKDDMDMDMDGDEDVDRRGSGYGSDPRSMSVPSEFADPFVGSRRRTGAQVGW